MNADWSKARTLESLSSTREFVQHALLGLALAHGYKPPFPRSITITQGSVSLDLTEFAKVFFQDQTNEKRFAASVTAIIVVGTARAYEAAKKYFLHNDRTTWDKKQWESLYLVSYQIRNMGSHGYVWRFRKDWIEKLRKNGLSFPLTYKNIAISESWHGSRAQVGQVPAMEVIRLIEDIYSDIQRFPLSHHGGEG